MVETLRPRKLDEALTWLSERKALPLAGGTDLMVHFRNYTGTDSLIVRPVLFTDAIDELHSVEDLGDSLKIGAACLLSELENNELVPSLLRQAISQIAAPALRNRATLAGNVCNASPAGDSLPPLYLYDSHVVLASSSGTRTIPLVDFITGPGKTIRTDDELLTHILVSKSQNEKIYYRKVGTRAANALSKLTVAAFAELENNIIMDLRMAFGAVAPVVVRERAVEIIFIGKSIDQVDLDEFRQAYAPHIRPIDDQRSTALYRKEVALNLAGDFIRKIQENL